jgi:2-polyprenyl-3-methyl-5-hydroxy-6-metoxy-1,4-benzoquinol methylase
MKNILEYESHFEFGKNWLDYAEKIDEEKILQAVEDLTRLNGGKSFQEKSFLDIGSGSGLHALAAIRMGAAAITCIDIDPNSVEATRKTLALYCPKMPVDIYLASIFNMNPQVNGVFDVVYSWGVLHHTGDMYHALESASQLVKVDGLFIVALYKKTFFCGLWTIIKKWYANTNPKNQKIARNIRTSIQKAGFLIRGKNFEEYVVNYGQWRGMNFENDLHDWMGGYPYESISPLSCHSFFKKLGFELENEFLTTPGGLGLLGTACDEYIFRKKRTA